DVPLDRTAVAQIETFPWVVTSDPAHHNEHCIEVQLPFLQSVLHAFSLVPLVIGECTSTQVSQVIDALWGGDETLVIVSSDLSHYLPYREANAVDADTNRAILARSHSLRGEQACGAYAINGLMRVADARSLHVEQLDLRNSGDTAGDKSRVVGYAAYALY
ncbi:MAG: AmmeMemoRadiSam system protein B, partial [Gammaproteobacteria bacterium]|nr:AmmeMemoRadiSam system protein B [Gammaproteobacteria bacterium]